MAEDPQISILVRLGFKKGCSCAGDWLKIYQHHAGEHHDDAGDNPPVKDIDAAVHYPGK